MDPEEICDLLNLHGRVLVLYAYQWTEQAEDCVQEAVLQLFRQAVRPPNVRAWLFRVVRNRALSSARSTRRRQYHETVAASLTRLPATESPFDAEDLAKAMETLSVELREVVVAHVWGGLTFEQIGELTNVATSTAHRRYEAALNHLRELLVKSCPNGQANLKDRVR